MEKFALPRAPGSPAPPAPQSTRRTTTRRHYDKFLRGPVPWSWLERASALGGKALHVGLALWQLKGMTDGWTVRLSLSSLNMGFDRSSASRGLAALARAGLIRVERAPGRISVVTIVDEGD